MADNVKAKLWHIPSTLGVFDEDGRQVDTHQAVDDHNALVKAYRELTEKPIACRLCGARFKSETEARAHRDAEHHLVQPIKAGNMGIPDGYGGWIMKS